MKKLFVVLLAVVSFSSFAGKDAAVDLEKYVTQLQNDCKKAGVNSEITYDVKEVAGKEKAGVNASKITGLFSTRCKNMKAEELKNFNDKVSSINIKHAAGTAPGTFDLKLDSKKLVFSADLAAFSDKSPESLADKLSPLLSK